MSLKSAGIFLFLFCTMLHLHAQYNITFLAVDGRTEFNDPKLTSLVVLESGTLVDSIPEERSWVEDWETVLPGPGSYEVFYRTIYGTTRRLTLPEIHDGDTIRIPVCELDYEKETWKPIIDRLRPGEKMNINFAARGCWASYEIDLTFSRKGKNLWASWGKEKVLLSEEQKKIIRRFEMELQYFKNIRNCTFKTWYDVTYDGKTDESYSYLDGSCDWWGFYYLMDALGAGEEWWEGSGDDWR